MADKAFGSDPTPAKMPEVSASADDETLDYFAKLADET